MVAERTRELRFATETGSLNDANPRGETGIRYAAGSRCESGRAVQDLGGSVRSGGRARRVAAFMD